MYVGIFRYNKISFIFKFRCKVAYAQTTNLSLPRDLHQKIYIQIVEQIVMK